MQPIEVQNINPVSYRTFNCEVQVPKGLNPIEIQEALIAVLYHINKISEPQACHILNIPRRKFEEAILPKYGLTTYSEDEEELEIELKAAGYETNC
ncbi:UPF0175 family protein [Candidatus Halobeggiatoa sp. HSG11]|nr:UPF0175 family protein [Candidatus Halobeggiatoa sp. HSG11]